MEQEAGGPALPPTGSSCGHSMSLCTSCDLCLALSGHRLPAGRFRLVDCATKPEGALRPSPRLRPPLTRKPDERAPLSGTTSSLWPGLQGRATASPLTGASQNRTSLPSCFPGYEPLPRQTHLFSRPRPRLLPQASFSELWTSLLALLSSSVKWANHICYGWKENSVMPKYSMSNPKSLHPYYGRLLGNKK